MTPLWTRILIVAAGGAVGSVARYLIGVAFVAKLGPGFPWGTLLVNVVGSGLLGALLQASRLPPNLLLGLGTGVMGGFTTYSTFNAETFRYLDAGAYGHASLYVGVTLVGCLVSCLLGFTLGRQVFG